MSDNPNTYFCLPDVIIFEDEESADAYVRERTKGEAGYVFDDVTAQTCYFEKTGCSSFAIICYPREKSEGVRNSFKLSILVHECSHIVDYWLEDIGVKECDTEIRAYALDAIFRHVLVQLGDEWIQRGAVSK